MNKYPINSKVIINSKFPDCKEPFCVGMMEYIGKVATVVDYTYSAREGYGWYTLYTLDVDDGRYYWTQEMLDKVEGGNSINPTKEQLEKINLFTHRELSADEVFVFSVILCDNEIDRDYERFTYESLETLAELYIGKTGVFDYNPKARGQAARIFATELIKDGKNTLGEEYYSLKAWAYMVRCKENENLILEIDTGIRKEVSVECAVEKIVCSICGHNIKNNPCEHKKGEQYAVHGLNGRKYATCHHILENPTDAYKWSFVTIPAQKRAGVLKSIEKHTKHQKDIRDKITNKNYYIEYEKEKGFTQTFTGYLENFNGLGTSAFFNDDKDEFLIIKTSWIVYMKMKES